MRQLQLGLFRNEPWEGRSPRGLTRARLGVIFKPRGVKDDCFFVDSLQFEMFPEAIKTSHPVIWGGSPSLIPLGPIRGLDSRLKQMGGE